MKRFLKISFCIILAITACFSLFACGDNNGNGDATTGMTIRKSAGAYIVKDYVKEVDANGNAITELTVSGATVATVYGATYNNEEVSIAEDAFKGNTSIKKLTVSKDVVKIGKGAFAEMTALEELVLPFAGSEIGAVNEARLLGYLFGSAEYDAGVKVTQTVSGDLSSADATPTTADYYVPATLKKVVIKYEGTDAYTLPQYTFSGVFSALRSVELSGNIVEIGAGAFYKSSVNSVTFPTSVTIIGNDAFSNCSLLTSINLQSVVTIGDRAFAKFAGVSVNFPTTVKNLGVKAFAESKLTEINSINGFDNIGKWAFYNSKDLAEILVTPNADKAQLLVDRTDVFEGTKIA